MDMKIQGDKGILQSNQVKRAQKSVDADQSRQGEDKVSFSSILRQAGKVGGVVVPPTTSAIEGLRAPVTENVTPTEGVTAGVSDMDVQRSTKVAELKQQIAEGSYQPDINKVAGSLVRFLAQERNV
ncbi:MAG: flagellar biosynthesis anti-sigma factor FlgM [Desulfuromonadaceae bacterium]|nr:flagellar biosynthesis anti-sigma factor FlgM [Desulfuromonadaceae bacterium]